MAKPKRRRSDRALRSRMQSPGRPPVARREDRQRFWAAIAKGLTSEDAGVAPGVSPVVGTRWVRQSGGMPTVSQAPLSDRYLSFVEREENALWPARGYGVRGGGQGCLPFWPIWVRVRATRSCGRRVG